MIWQLEKGDSNSKGEHTWVIFLTPTSKISLQYDFSGYLLNLTD